jgi:hypothetical protein
LLIGAAAWKTGVFLGNFRLELSQHNRANVLKSLPILSNERSVSRGHPVAGSLRICQNVSCSFADSSGFISLKPAGTSRPGFAEAAIH